MDSRALAELHELGRRDEGLAAAAARLRELEAAVTRTRARAEAIDAFFAAYPEQESRARAAVGVAEEEVRRRGGELAAAESHLAAARNDEEREHAEQGLARA
ncbi:MAG: hypothetical protein ACXVYM_10010, partial [Gaiellaceae bacterium]